MATAMANLRREQLLSQMECAAITPGNHETFKPASKPGYPIISRVYFFKQFEKLAAIFFLVVLYEDK